MQNLTNIPPKRDKPKRDKLIIATRGGTLATAQALIVSRRLNAIGVRTELLFVSTKGDQDRSSPLHTIGGDGLFVRKIEEAVLSNEADLAVHSAKDLPFSLMEALMIGAVADSGDPRDVLLCKGEASHLQHPSDDACVMLREKSFIKGESTQSQHLSDNACARSGEKLPTIGTCSERRRIQFLKLFGEAEFIDLRGNITTRLSRLDEGKYDGIILAKAGLDRIGVSLSNYTHHVFSIEEMVPAAGQGLIAVECRENDEEVREMLSAISIQEGMERLRIERYVFRQLGASCSLPVGVFADIQKERLTLTGLYGDRKAIVTGNKDDYITLVEDLKGELVQ